ncbi:MAG: heavy-metal-associated domain-containing protein [Bacteroidota bacterium]|nr:heavy-metal-associated domain-containing protein [Bacteroidota bacterium]
MGLSFYNTGFLFDVSSFKNKRAGCIVTSLKRMQRIAFFLGMIVLVSTSNCSFGQGKGIDKAVIHTPGVMADACKTGIENFLVHEYGVSSVKADYRKHTVTVSWYTNRTNIENIKTALANMGYDADDVSAEPDAYKKLLPACKPAMIPMKDSTVRK